MEKLILRGVMYGADKIPDSWFEKVPGGYYKDKGAQERQKDKSRKGGSTYGPPPGAQKPYRNGRTKSRGRRHSDEYDDRRPRYDEDYAAGQRPGYGTDRHGRHGRSRSSVDGGDDYDPYADRRGYDDTYGRPSGRRQDEARYDPSPLSSRMPPYPAGGPPAGRDYIPPVAFAAAAPAPHGMSQSRVPPAGNGVSSGYVPYANIYGSAQGRPPGSNNGSVQPSGLNQVATPFSPPGSTAPGASSFKPSRAGYDPDPYYDDRYYDDRYPEEYETGYVPPSRPPPHDRRQRSPSYDTYDPQHRRARSERRRTTDSPQNGPGFRARERRRDDRRNANYAGDHNITSRHEARERSRRDDPPVTARDEAPSE